MSPFLGEKDVMSNKKIAVVIRVPEFMRRSQTAKEDNGINKNFIDFEKRSDFVL
jgi:hypothetical protein